MPSPLHKAIRIAQGYRSEKHFIPGTSVSHIRNSICQEKRNERAIAIQMSKKTNSSEKSLVFPVFLH